MLRQVRLLFVLMFMAMCVPLSAGEPIKLDAAKVRVTATAYRIGTMKELAFAFSNRPYRWKGIPKQLVGWKYTQLFGGQKRKMQVTCEKACDVFIATAPSQPMNLDGWEPVEGLTFRYAGKNTNVKMQVYSRRCEPGQTLTIPQDNWAGATLLAPEMWAKIDTSWIDLSKVPGVVIDHQPAWSAMYIGSPSIAILPNGDYVASHDLFGGGSTFNEMGQTRLFTSSDRGKTWSRLPDLLGQFWGTLFVHRGDLYIIGARHRFGDTVIRRSTDGGRTWTDPVDGKSGLILHDRTHCAPQPVLIHNGRLWRAMEDVNGGNRWGRWFRTFMMSVPVDADLLDASNWTISNRLASDQKWADGRFNGWLEGNAVATPDGEVVNLLRTEISPEGGHVSRVHISADGKTATFDPENDILDMPGGNKKFTIRFDPVSKHYWSLTNWVPPNITTHNPGGVRNTLALIRSKDLIHWTVRTVVLHHEDRNCHGFQYVDWVFDGDDIVAVSRTGYDDGIGGAHSAHDANLMTFHRVSNFRNLSWADSVVDPATLGVDVKAAQ